MTVRLNPPSLGALRIELSTSQGSVQTTFEASTDQAHELLTRNLASLRSALESRGLNVTRMDVSAPAPTNANASHATGGQHQFGADAEEQERSFGQEAEQQREDGDDGSAERDPRGRVGPEFAEAEPDAERPEEQAPEWMDRPGAGLLNAVA